MINFTRLDVGVAYRDARTRIVECVAGLTPTQWEQRVPHCPAWTVRETLAHLAGVADDGINGNMEGVASDPWTAAQVAKRADLSGPDIVAEWQFSGPFVDGRATELGLSLAQLIFDTVTHEHDMRFALNAPGARESDGMLVALAFVSRVLPTSAANAGIGLQVLIPDPSSTGVVHALPSVASAKSLRPLTLRTTLFDFVRMSGSRRSEEQVRAMNWSDDPTPILSLLPFALPNISLPE